MSYWRRTGPTERYQCTNDNCAVWNEACRQLIRDDFIVPRLLNLPWTPVSLPQYVQQHFSRAPSSQDGVWEAKFMFPYIGLIAAALRHADHRRIMFPLYSRRHVTVDFPWMAAISDRKSRNRTGLSNLFAMPHLLVWVWIGWYGQSWLR